MKLCVFGAGAIGGLLAVELADAGADVCVVARGPHLDAIRTHGLTLLTGGGRKTVRVPASDDPRDFGPQDYVLSALKANQSHESAAAFLPLLGPDTAVVTASNGIPWWYFYKDGSAWEGCRLTSVDPGARQWDLIGPRRAIGCVVEPACEVVAPGVIEHHRYRRFILGEPDGTASPRVTALSHILSRAGFDAPVRDAIRWNVWLKLWGNVCFNPISLLTGDTLDRMLGDTALRSLCRTLMLEAKAIADALGVMIPETMIERRLTAAEAIVGHKMSMLQDLERGRALELDAIVTAVQELGRLTGLATPAIDMVLALAQARGRNAGLYEPSATPSSP